MKFVVIFPRWYLGIEHLQINAIISFLSITNIISYHDNIS